MKLDKTFENQSLSHATMREEDTIPAFMYFLEEHDQEKATKITSNYSGEGWPYSMDGLSWGDPFNAKQSELAPDLLDDLVNALNSIAPEGFYFGSHPGNSSDYGFWPNEEDGEEDES